MIFAVIENFVFFSTLFALESYLAASLIRLGSTRNWWKFSPFQLSRIYAGLILLPIVFALWVVLTALLPEIWLGTDVFKSAHAVPVHQLRLLTDLTAPFEPYLSSATVLFVATATFFVLWKSVRSYFRIGSIVRFLEIEAVAPAHSQIALVENTARQHRLDVGLVMSEQPLTFVWGFWHSKLVLSSGLLNTLTAMELRGVIEHEAAHHHRRVNAVKLLLALASYLSLVFPLTRGILRWQAEQVELVCDEIAAVQSKAPLEIALALIKLHWGVPPQFVSLPLTAGFVTGEKTSIEGRVKRLLWLDDKLPSPSRTGRLASVPHLEIVFLITLFPGSLLTVLSLAPLAVHTAAENIIKFIP